MDITYNELVELIFKLTQMVEYAEPGDTTIKLEDRVVLSSGKTVDLVVI